MMFFVVPNDFADKTASIPNFNLVNQPSLDKILKAEVFVHTNGQLRAAHLILDYIPISKSFQAPKCVIKAKDPRLQRINVAAPGFLLSGPIPERQKGEVAILMIDFIEGGMRIHMGTVTRDYLKAHRLVPTQCTLNMFRILGSVDALNERMGLGLTHHNIN